MKILKVMARSYVMPADVDATIAFYEQLLREKCEIRFPIPSLGIEIATVGAIHIVAGAEEKLAPFREVRAAFFVDSVLDFQAELERLGANILQQPEQGPFGMFMIAKHPDGVSVEYADTVTSQVS
jgi:predicted enzyme related to lactoylglutathione lyase